MGVVLFMIDRSQPQGPVNLIPVPVFLDLGERYQPRPQSKGSQHRNVITVYGYIGPFAFIRLRGFPLGRRGTKGVFIRVRGCEASS